MPRTPTVWGALTLSWSAIMKHLDALIEQYMDGMITRSELEALIFVEAAKHPSPEFTCVWDEYTTYVSEELGD